MLDSKMNFDPIRYWTERVGPDATLADTGVKDFSLGYNEKLYKLKTFAFKRLLGPHAAQLFGQRALNVGCGIGYFENWLERVYGMRTCGVDVSLELMHALTRRHRQRRYICWNFADGPSPEFLREHFRLLTFIDVLYHIIDDEKWSHTLQNAIAHLCPGGLVLMTDITGGSAPCTGPHVRFRSLTAYEEQFSACGLKRLAEANMYFLFNRFYSPWAKPSPALTWLMFIADKILAPHVSTDNMVSTLWVKQTS
jgi:2-polyprenyl-3-methyl-5-hydroxy-6-metoxy-1,4-benzoquinol methylase